jgi:hypothetical protein
MHRPTISEIEAGNRRVSGEELAKFAETYVTIAWLLAETAEQLETSGGLLRIAFPRWTSSTTGTRATAVSWSRSSWIPHEDSVEACV